VDSRQVVYGYAWHDASNMRLADLVPEESRGQGLSDSELVSAQAEAGVAFPPDLCELLSDTLPSGRGFPDWRTRPRDAMDEWRAYLVDGIHFDVLHNDFWPNRWPARPDAPAESREIVEQRLAEAPALIPICSHRGIPNEPLVSGNPVFSVSQTDIIIYGNDLADYLQHEFHGWDGSGDLPERTIRFWTAMLDL
jgi:hypothetical protein